MALGQMMPGGLPRPMQPPQQQFVQTLGQIPQQQPPQMSQGMTAQQMHPFLQHQPQLLQQQFPQPNMQQMQNFNQMPQQNQAGKMMIPGSQVAGLTNMILGHSALGTQPASAQAWQGQSQGQPPVDILAVDILGLADKAAQALSGRIPQQANGLVPMANPNFPPPPARATQSFQHHQQNMASEKDLPMMVQYAIQVSTVCKPSFLNWLLCALS